ncbi:MAG TPA: SGNH/GDSL hydrolase family protein [Nocardioides sp.]
MAAVSGGMVAASEPHHPGPLTVGFLGDSWTCGLGLSDAGTQGDETRGFTAQAADELGWSAVTECVGGTGYTRPAGATYGDRLGDLLDAKPDVVVVQGSTNDVPSDPDDLAAAAAAVLNRIAEELPDASRVVVGPAYTPGSSPGRIDLLRDVLADAAADHDEVWLDLVDAQLADDHFTDDFHPTDAGHARLGRWLAEELGLLANGGPRADSAPSLVSW